MNTQRHFAGFLSVTINQPCVPSASPEGRKLLSMAQQGTALIGKPGPWDLSRVIKSPGTYMYANLLSPK